MPSSTAPPLHASSNEGAFDGDPAWRVTRTLLDGTPITIRPVTPEDREEMRRAFGQLSPESRYYRFFHAHATPTEELLTYLTSVDQKTHVALGATIESPDLKSERGIGVARFILLDDSPTTAEVAITVIDEMHRRGVGRALLRELLLAARLRGIRTFRAQVLADNETMRAVLERAGARIVHAESGEGTIAYDLTVAEREVGRDFSLFEILRVAAETMALRFRWNS